MVASKAAGAFVRLEVVVSGWESESPAETAMEQMSIEGVGPAAYTVTELTAAIHRLLTLNFDDVRVTGEVSGYKVWTSGHAYFTLKDGAAQVRCVLFRNVARYLKVKPADGMQVRARGSVEVRQERGEYQLVVSGIEPQGEGELQLAFERLKRKLLEEGLFETDRKRPLPAFPSRIGVVTSPRGAVIRDILSVLGRRWPMAHVRLYPTKVQGEGAVEGICAALEQLGGSGWPEVIILARGGGSIEDLWTFNEEAVARAIFNCPVPVVSGVGHETDFTIADFVADLRAPTPSAAAELIAPDLLALLDHIDTLGDRAGRALSLRVARLARLLAERGSSRPARLVQRMIGRAQQRADELDYGLRLAGGRQVAVISARLEGLDRRLRRQDARLKLSQSQLRASTLTNRLNAAIRTPIQQSCARLGQAAAHLDALSPLAVLGRGYAIVEGPHGILRDAADVSAGDPLGVRLSRGRLGARVESVEPAEPAPSTSRQHAGPRPSISGKIA
ncbi:MAG TPA: exodeoxyribonuclease VII large subunit [Bryobacteraceae bacterium]|nr:exodeoxyribonuclease VII large subunit [Bryobacteraceae bacterium]HPT27254.1 exodeoxyribonuclease VII large subunit [Bryobacteraceae bacterium]